MAIRGSHMSPHTPTWSVCRLRVITKGDEPKVMFSTHEEEYDGDTEGLWIFHDEEGNEYNLFMARSRNGRISMIS